MCHKNIRKNLISILKSSTKLVRYMCVCVCEMNNQIKKILKIYYCFKQVRSPEEVALCFEP